MLLMCGMESEQTMTEQLTTNERLDQGVAAAMADDDWDKEHEGAIGISELGRCGRIPWLRLHNLPKTNLPTPEQQYAMLHGRWAHDLLLDLLQVSDEHRNWKVEFTLHEVPIVGHVDGYRNGRLLEIKTGSQGGVTHPFARDEIQLAGYMWPSASIARADWVDGKVAWVPVELDSRQGELFYKLNNGQSASFLYDEPPELAVEHIDWIVRKIRDAKDFREVPCDRTYCRGCDWQDYCEEHDPPQKRQENDGVVSIDMAPRLLRRNLTEYLTERILAKQGEDKVKELSQAILGEMTADALWEVYGKGFSVKRTEYKSHPLDVKAIPPEVRADLPTKVSVTRKLVVTGSILENGDENGS